MDISHKNNSRFLKWIVALALTVVANLFVHYLFISFYPTPQYDQFCKREQVTTVAETKEACVLAGGGWTDTPEFSKYDQYGVPVPAGRTIDGYCDPDFTCRATYEEASRLYNRAYFIARVMFGVVAIGVAFSIGSQAVSFGLSMAGLFSLVIGTASYWSELADNLRVIVLGFALIILIYFGSRKLE